MRGLILVAAVAGMAIAPLSARPSGVGVNYDRLLDAIAKVESDRGATSANVYQLRRIYVRDVNRINGWSIRYDDAIRDPSIAKRCILAYWRHYARSYERRTGRKATAETLARMHNGGPDGWRETVTVRYWRRVSRIYKAGGGK